MMLLNGCKVDDYAIKKTKSVHVEIMLKEHKKYVDSLTLENRVMCLEPYLPIDVEYESGESHLIKEYMKHLKNYPRIVRKLPIFIDLCIDEKGKVYDVDIFNTNLNIKMKEQIKSIGINKLQLFAPATNWNSSPRKAIKSIVLENYIKYTP